MAPLSLCNKSGATQYIHAIGFEMIMGMCVYIYIYTIHSLLEDYFPLQTVGFPLPC